MSATGALALSAVTSLAESGEAAAALPRAMKRLPWRTPDGPRGVPGLPPSCTRRAVTAATLRAAGSKFLFDGCVIVPAEPSLGLSSGAGTYWSRRESRRLPPPGTQETIDTALESAWRGECSFVEKKCSFEVDATRISVPDLSAHQATLWLMRTFRALRRRPAR